VRALIFDLDGTLIDTVYAHVFAWQRALAEAGLAIDGWKIHRRIGMSGGLFLRALDREVGIQITAEQAERLQQVHGEGVRRRLDQIRPLPGARELLRRLSDGGVPWAIATSGRAETAHPIIRLLEVPEGTVVITRDEVPFAKPNPDLFLAAAAALGTKITESFVVGDSVWDMLAAQRAHALGIGVLSGGYGEEELESAGAFRVYDDPQDLLEHIDELGIRTRT